MQAFMHDVDGVVPFLDFLALVGLVFYDAGLLVEILGVDGEGVCFLED